MVLFIPSQSGSPYDDKQHDYLVQGVPLKRRHLLRSPLWRRLNTRLYYFPRQSFSSFVSNLVADPIEPRGFKANLLNNNTALNSQSTRRLKVAWCVADPEIGPNIYAYRTLFSPIVTVFSGSHFLAPMAFFKSV